MFSMKRFVARSVLIAAAGLVPLALAMQAEAAETASGTQVWLRLSPSQYKQSINEVFGPGIAISGRFEPELRDDGMAALGARRASVTDTGLERYDDLARGIAKQVVSPRNRGTLIHCKPASATAADDVCARDFISKTGRLLYRRPLTENEISAQVAVARAGAEKLKDFYAGISASLGAMLVAPDFLFRYQNAEPDPNKPGQFRLDALSKANQLSYFLWNTTPDEMLLKAAEDGSIHTKEGLTRQVDRMVSSPAVEGGVRAYFIDMLGFADFETLSKDPEFFPRFTQRVKEQAQEQTLRTIVNHLVKRRGDYRDLFTTRDTFMTVSLAALYDVPLAETNDNGQPERWISYTFEENDPRAGLLAQASFVALHSPAGRTSPTDRGKALRELLLCQMVPAPPANVDFSVVQDTSSQIFRTTRERLTAHRTEAMCAGCHKITDPMGLALENFDSAGGWRTHENGVEIDVTGDFNNVKFDGPLGLAKVLRDDPAITSCVARKVYAFGAGRFPQRGDAEFEQIQKKFADSKFNFLELMRQIALSDVMYAVPPAEQQKAQAQ